ncbi:glycosyltransferase [Sphingomonas agri]|uniref:glycosyltransferase n=1 Tax=Sphingomonas agri TaxID=1813878 RepID=UPI00311FD472
MRLAYLCNVYPAVSHSFVRREIDGIEAAGNEVHRFSLRPPQAGLKDEADLREASITESVLQQGIVRLSLAALALLFSRPGRTFAALKAALRLSSPGIERKARHVAYWLEAAWLVRRMDELGVQHLHAHFGTNPAAVATIVRTWGGPTFSFTVHGPDEFDAPLTLGLPAKIEAAAFVVAITSYCRSQLMRWSAPDHWGKIELIRCGLDDDILNAPPDPVPAASTEFVCVARLSAQKGLPLLIAASERLRDSGETFSVTLVGGGELRETLERDIKDRGLQGIVRLAGVRSTPDMHEDIRAARAFVLPSFAEGLPMTIMEAFALSRPVITTAIAGIPELVDDQCGWVITAGSVEALVEAMRSALHTPAEQLSRKGAVGRERVLRLHSVKSTAAGIVRAIEARSA